MKKDNFSVWRLPWSKRYYLTHPWVWFKDIGHCIRDAYRRARYGWTYVDCWNWDTWFLSTTPAMLRHMADYGSAYPGYPPFDGDHGTEKWHEWLHEVADLLETGLEDWQDEHNEYYDEFIRQLDTKWEPAFTDEHGFIHHKPKERSELENKYFARHKELSDQGEKNVRRALSMIAEHFYSLWD